MSTRNSTFVSEDDAPGITEYKQQLQEALVGSGMEHFEHEQIIAKLDQSALTFRVLVIKTNTKIPYTSVFFELDCGYWNADAEERLRRAMRTSNMK